MYSGGFTGKVLRIDLTNRTSKVESLPFETARDYIGGAGFCIKYLFDELETGIDPLGEKNKLVFAAGPFTGTSVPCASRMAVGAKSPLTGTLGVAMTGGHFPAELKFAGYDVLIIEGRAEKPTTLVIKDDAVHFRSADTTWGMKTIDCQQIIKDELGDQNFRVACIGPAGENLSRIACIINEMRAAGRRGLGAVMGSKNLKAIAVRGTGEVPIASEELFKTARGEMAQAMKHSPVLYPEFAKWGTPMTVDVTCSLGIFPTKNFQTTGEFSPIEELGTHGQESRNVGSQHCFKCPVGCSQLKLAKEGPYAGVLSEGPEYETVFSFGGQVGIIDMDTVIAADRLADELGLDTISAGVAVGFAMELHEKGILKPEDAGGLDLSFGNAETLMTLLHQMAYRKDLGAVLADGVKHAAEQIGQGTEKYAMHVKGLELPAYDVRGAKAHGLNYATAYSGADHNRGYAFQEIFSIPVPYEVDRFAIEGKGVLTKWNQDIRTATADCPTMCVFLLDMAVAPVAGQNTANLMEAVTGIKMKPEDVEIAGERINNLAKVFNVREGFTRADDNLPERLMTEPLKDGASKGQFVSQEDLDAMLDEYYSARGWDSSGAPTKEKLEQLGLAYAAKYLEG
jgi:aldehyde:ferredoxin oxidoreductase